MVGLQSVMANVGLSGRNNQLETDVDFIEVDVIVTAAGTTQPADPYYTQQWGLAGGRERSTDIADIRIEETWEHLLEHNNNKPNDDRRAAKEQTVVIAVVDTGVDYLHKELVNRMWVNEKELNGLTGVDDDGNGFIDDIYGYDFAGNDSDPMDEDGHGTHCAGIIAAEANNMRGIAGVFQGARIMALRFLTNSKMGFISDAIRSLDYAVSNGARVLSNSWGGTSKRTKSLEAILDLCNTKNILFVAAAGNFHNDNDRTPDYPSSYSHSNVLSVTATTRSGALASFSNYGNTSVDISAPGDDILSLSVRTDPDGMYKVRKGTSMSCPTAAAVASLIWSYHMDDVAVGGDISTSTTTGVLRNYELKRALIVSSRRLESLEGKMVGGLLDAMAAVEEVEQMLTAKRWVSFDSSISSVLLKPSESIVIPITLTAMEHSTTHRSTLQLSLESRGVQLESSDIPITIRAAARSNNPRQQPPPTTTTTHNGVVVIQHQLDRFVAVRGAYTRPREVAAKFVTTAAENQIHDRGLRVIVVVDAVEGEGANSFYTLPAVKQFVQVGEKKY
eukprot:GHVS01022445.1.p1 GENE.GHVS01022445.1~~GHVS01022445.1.p1  ORF type:complete len:643 (-),score=110.63 GHVS01022445.1:397-2076(-)